MTTDLVRKYAAGPTQPATAKGAIPGWLSVPVIDRSRDFLDGSDMDLSEYLPNPVVLWCHKADQPPIARVPDLAARAYPGSPFNGLFGHFEFDPGDEFSAKVRDKYEAGYLRGFSVGFVPHGGWRELTADELNKLGVRKGTRARRMVKGRLLEASCVPVPDNQAALSVVMKAFGHAIPDAYKAAIADLTPPQSTFAADLTKVSPGRFPASVRQSPSVTTPEAAVAEQPKTDDAPPPLTKTVDADVVVTELDDQSVVLLAGVKELGQRLDDRHAADAEFKAALLKGLEDGIAGLAGRADALAEDLAAVTAELAEAKAWRAKAEEFQAELAKAVAGLYQRKGR